MFFPLDKDNQKVQNSACQTKMKLYHKVRMLFDLLPKVLVTFKGNWELYDNASPFMEFTWDWI